MTAYVNRAAIEQRDGTQLAVFSARIQRSIVGWAIDVDHIARVGGHQQTRTEASSEVVEAIHVPIGVRQRSRAFGHTVEHVRGYEGAGVRHADEKRRPSGMVLIGRHRSYTRYITLRTIRLRLNSVNHSCGVLHRG